MFVSASTDCFAELPLMEAIEKLEEFEYSCVEIAIHENGIQLKPSEVAANLERAVNLCRLTHRLDLAAYSVEFGVEGEEAYRQFQAICRLAKATKVVTLTIRTSEQGTPFNEEVERLRKLVAIATVEGVRVAIRNEAGRISEDVGTITVLCDHVEGLGLALDPSHFVFGPQAGKNYDPLLKYVYHVILRDTSEQAFQVRVGQGLIEYGRLVSTLERVGYDRALSVHVLPQADLDHIGELRKMRLLLESLL